MKLYISMDMEGIPGTFNWEHEKHDPQAVKRYCFNHIRDLIQALEQCPENADLTDILIADSHSIGENLEYDITLLDERITLISGGPRPFYMMPLLDESFDLVFLVGYHAGTGALQANMDHTYSNSRIQKISINGRRMNEALINAAYAGVKGVPVALVTGDLALQKELMDPEALPWVHYVCTKEGVSKFAALNYNQIRVKRNLVTNVQQALRQNKAAYPLFAFSAPVRLEIEFHSTAMADMACLMPYTKRLDGRSIEYVTDDYPVLFEAIMALVTLAYATGI